MDLWKIPWPPLKRSGSETRRTSTVRITLHREPFPRTVTDEQAAMHPLVILSNHHDHLSKTSTEVLDLRDALKAVLDRSMKAFEVGPKIYDGSNYILGYGNIQHQLDGFTGWLS